MMPWLIHYSALFCFIPGLFYFHSVSSASHSLTELKLLDILDAGDSFSRESCWLWFCGRVEGWSDPTLSYQYQTLGGDNSIYSFAFPFSWKLWLMNTTSNYPTYFKLHSLALPTRVTILHTIKCIHLRLVGTNFTENYADFQLILFMKLLSYELSIGASKIIQIRSTLYNLNTRTIDKFW